MRKLMTIVFGACLAVSSFGQGFVDARIEDMGGEKVTVTDSWLDCNQRGTVLDVARGLVTGQSSINKFGRTQNADDADLTDIWDGANIALDQSLWVQATTGQTHRITATNANDHANGIGARTIRIYGLPDWDTAEISEDVTLLGVTNVFTANKYVIIHRAKVLTAGTNGVNMGNVLIDAHADDTLGAMITAKGGQTKMAIYGIPSTQDMYIYNLWLSMNRAVATTRGNVFLLVNEIPNTTPLAFLHKHTMGFHSTGTSAFDMIYAVPKKITGPAIVKMQVAAGVNDTDVSAGWDAVLITK